MADHPLDAHARALFNFWSANPKDYHFDCRRLLESERQSFRDAAAAVLRTELTREPSDTEIDAACFSANSGAYRTWTKNILKAALAARLRQLGLAP